ncbi:DUF6221 family protein [Streptomyces sp. NPDC102283]|uniref:DUF6221 family protein n=1 Tax=Streptomyces sp. NPDC102283 TaxID=3366155 RepID=UPI003824C106
MDDLVQFLRDRLTDDAQAARRAGDSFRQIGETGVIVATDGDRAEECASANWSGIAEHIVRHDPARVLAEIDAKRSVLDLAERARDYHETFVNGFAAALENTLRLYALPYADHPDYRPEWRP